MVITLLLYETPFRHPSFPMKSLSCYKRVWCLVIFEAHNTLFLPTLDYCHRPFISRHLARILLVGQIKSLNAKEVEKPSHRRGRAKKPESHLR